MTVVKKKKHVSKKNKKDWRKHCDIRDVEDFLDDQRLEERLGKFDTKPDSELFIVDTAGGDAKPIEYDDTKPLSARLKKRQKLANATPKCFEVLIPDSKVQDPNAKRNIVKPIGSKLTALSKITDKRKEAKGVYKRKLEDARADRKKALEKKRKAKQVRHNFDLDMWGGEVPSSKSIPATLVDEFIPPSAQLHNVLPSRRLRARPPLAPSVQRRAVEAPHPGVSYNPSYEEHQELLHEVVKHEEKMIKKEKHLHRVTTGMFSRVTPQEKESQWLEEMSIGLPTPHDPSAAPTPHDPSAAPTPPDSDAEYRAVNPPVRNKKKDLKTRRKQRERLLERERLKRAKVDKQKITDLYKLRQLRSTITSNEQKLSSLREKRAAKRAQLAETCVPSLNAHKVALREPELVEPSQLTGDLRHITPTTNLLRERFESLQRRGALAASKVMMKKKKKVKSYFKAGHKVTDQDVARYLDRDVGNK